MNEAAAPVVAPIEILYVIDSLDVGGAERHLARVAGGLTRRGYKVTIHCLLRAGSEAARAEAAGVRVMAPRLEGPPGRYKGLLWSLILALSSLRLFATLLIRRPRIVHFFLPRSYMIGAIAARLAGLRRLVMSRRGMNAYQKKRPRLARLERYLHRSVIAALGNSKLVVEQLRHEGVPADRLGLIYNGIDLAPFAQIAASGDSHRERQRAALGLPRDALVLVTVANLIKYKGHADLLDALAAIAGRLPQDWALLIVGRDEGIGATLEAQGQRLGLGPHLHFLGLRHDVPELLMAADIGLLCSHEEGFPNAVLEGMAAGLPMVVTDVGGNGEAVVQEETGLVVKSRAPDQLAGAILRLATERGTARRMGEEGKRRVARHFALQDCVDNYDRLYRALLEGRSPAEVTLLADPVKPKRS